MDVVHKRKRKKNVYYFVIVIVVVILIVNPFNIVGFLRSFTAEMIMPLKNSGQSFGRTINSSFSVFFNIRDVSDQNQELLQKNQELESQVAQIQDLKRENDHLRNEIGLLPRDAYEIISTEVVIRDNVGGNHWVMVNKGTRDGVEENMAAIVGESVFVGYVDMVDHDVSRIRLLTHPDSVITVVDAKSGAEAVARGRHGLSIIVEDIKKGAEVNNGNMFITSQVGNRFPRGLSVGTGQNISLSEDGLFQSANIIPAADLDSLHFVSIIKNAQ
jgi:rod shape-determining protein MreC